MNIVFEVADLGHGLVFQNLAYYGWVSHNTHILYLKIIAKMLLLIENLLGFFFLSFSIPTKNIVEKISSFNQKLQHWNEPLHFLNNFVKEILASDSSQSYLRKVQAMTMKLVTNDLSKSTAMETIK